MESDEHVYKNFEEWYKNYWENIEGEMPSTYMMMFEAFVYGRIYQHEEETKARLDTTRRKTEG